ncbi:reverse transcriptase domain-containing protein, partial [Tanacetum coccineum]
TSAQRGESSRSITSSSHEIAALTQQISEMNKNFLRMSQSNQQVNVVNPSYETCGGPHHYSECQAASSFTQGYVYAATGNYNVGERPQGALPSNTIPNPREYIKVITTRSGITLVGPSVPSPNSSSSSKEVERDPKTTMDQVHISSPGSTARMFKKLHFNISFAKALAQMLKYAKMLKDILTNKEKLLELANTPLNENCSVVLLKKLPEKLRDLGKFLIPCDFSELEECLALSDLGVSLNLMPLSVWKNLMLPKLTPTRMTLELANRSVAYQVGIAEDVFVQVGKFTFPADFVVIDYDIDPCVPLILGRPFLRTIRALVDVHGEKLTLRVGNEKLSFNVESTSKYPHKHGDGSINQIDIIETTCEDHFHEVLNFQKSIHPLSGSPTPSSNLVVASLSPSLTPFRDSDFLLEDTDTFLYLDDSIPPEIDNGIYDSEGDILFLEKLLNDDPIKDLPPKELKNEETKTTKSSIEEPPELELKDLRPHLEGIDPNFCTHTILMEDDFKPAVQQQRRVNPKIHEVVKAGVIKLLDAGLIYPISDIPWVSLVHVVPKKCGMTVVANGHKISKTGIKVDHAKVDVTAKLPPPTTVHLKTLKAQAQRSTHFGRRIQEKKDFYLKVQEVRHAFCEVRYTFL